MLGQTYLDGLSMALDGLEKILDRPMINEDDRTDLGAKLNAAFNRLETLNKKSKECLKAELLIQGKTVWQGKFFEAVMQKFDVTRLATEKVKVFLGKKLKDFQITNAEYRISFRPRA